MSKSILVIDTPEGCVRCDCCHTKDYDFRERIDGEKICGIEKMNVDDYCDGINLRKPDWCPLLDLPQKKEEKQYLNKKDNRGNIETYGELRDMLAVGWNMCIDEILKGANGSE